MVLKDRFPLAHIDFPSERGGGCIDFFRTPLGSAIRIALPENEMIKEIKMYDKNRSRFVIQNVFCGDNLIEIEKGIFVGISNKLSIEEAVGRDFLIKLDSINVIARAENLLLSRVTAEKASELVYN